MRSLSLCAPGFLLVFDLHQVRTTVNLFTLRTHEPDQAESDGCPPSSLGEQVNYQNQDVEWVT
jgi:hypothetical protein